MLYNQTDWITEQLEHVLEKALHIENRLRGTISGGRTEMTSALQEVVWKMMNLIPRQCEMKNIFEEPSSTEI